MDETINLPDNDCPACNESFGRVDIAWDEPLAIIVRCPHCQSLIRLRPDDVGGWYPSDD